MDPINWIFTALGVWLTLIGIFFQVLQYFNKRGGSKWNVLKKSIFMGTVPSTILYFIGNAFWVKSDFDQPQLSISYSSKPYLRYIAIDTSGLEFSYEICLKNSGKNPAIELVYTKLTQALVVNVLTVATVEGKKSKNPPPQRLVSGEHYCQVFMMNSTTMKSDQIRNYIKRYNSGELAIVLELEIQYKDGITGKKYSFNERNKVFKDMVQIL